jgi:pyridoxamine 5'-phosphate oxidase-like protein
MTTLDDAVALAAGESALAVVSTLRANGTIQASLVNAGALPHPSTGEPRLGFVTYGKVKLANLRVRPQLAVTFRNGWQWATVEGNAELAGPDDSQEWLKDAEQLRLLLREVFTLVEPSRVYSNG